MRPLSARVLLTCLLSLLVAGPAYSQHVYRDRQNGISLSLPAGWKWSVPQRWDDQKGEQSILRLREAGTAHELRLYVAVLDPPESPMSAEKMNARLMKQARSKVEQRKREGYENYRLREDSFESHPVNGRSALSWVADYTSHGHNMVEYLTRVRSENTNALFFARLPAEQLEEFETHVKPILESLQIP